MMMSHKKALATISEYMVNAGETVAIAESVTAGLIMSNFASAHNASGFFQGGITTYNLGQKTRQLNVEPIHAEITNCVSERVAQKMAVEVSKLFCSEWGIGITGYASPVPALKIKSCFAIYSIAYNRIPVVVARIDTKLKEQDSVKKYFAKSVINAFANHIRQLNY